MIVTFDYIWRTNLDPRWERPIGVRSAIAFDSVSEGSRPGRSDGDSRRGGIGILADGAKVGPGIYPLADSLDAKLTDRQRNNWEAQFGYRPQGETVTQCILDQLTGGSDPTGLDAVMPSMPLTHLELYLGGPKPIYRAKYDWSNPHTAKMLAVIQAGNKDLWEHENSNDPKRPRAGTTQRVIDKLCIDRRVSKEEYKLFLPADLKEHVPPPLKHGTYFRESFDQADSTTLGPDQSHTEVLNNSQTIDGKATNVTLNARIAARMDADVSSPNHYCQCQLVTYNQGTPLTILPGPCVRFSPSAETYYSVNRGNNTAGGGAVDGYVMARVVAGFQTLIGTYTVFDSFPVAALPEVLKISVIGDAVRSFINGVLIDTASDSNIPGNTRGGFRLRGNAVSDAEIDNLEVNDAVYPQHLINGGLVRSTLVNSPICIGG